MSLVLNVEILGEFKKLTEATTGSQKSLSGLEKNAKSISKGINTALGAIGIGFSLNFLVDQFKESTKAAIEDQKSKVLLTKALEDNLNVSKAQVAQVEQYISKTQLATSVTDDRLRPAFAKLAISTKDTDEAMRLMNIALDVSAGTGKNLDSVVQAMSRSLAGSDTALTRLVPSIKGATDPMKALEETFGGAAEAAANTDPYAKLQVVLGEMQEQIGEALLPILQQFSAWLTTPEGQEKLQAIVDGIVDVVKWFGEMSGFISDKVMPTLEKLTGDNGFGAVVKAITAVTVAIGVAKIAFMAFTMGNPVLAGILAGLGLLAAAIGYIASNWEESTLKAQDYLDQLKKIAAANAAAISGGGETPFTGTTVVPGGNGIGSGSGGTQFTGTTVVPQKTGNVTVNINGSKLTASEIVKELQNYGLQVGRTFIPQ